EERARGSEPQIDYALVTEYLRSGDRSMGGGRYEQALKDYQAALSRDHENPQILIACGLAETAAGRFDRAAAALHEAIGRQPDLAKTKFDIRDIFTRADDLASRVSDLKRRADAKDADALLVLGFVQSFSGHQAEGRDAFDRYMTIRS